MAIEKMKNKKKVPDYLYHKEKGNKHNRKNLRDNRRTEFDG